MKVSFDGIRKNIAGAYNTMVISLDGQELNDSQKDAIDGLRSMIFGLLCIYDDSDKEGFSDLSDKIKLQRIYLEDEE